MSEQLPHAPLSNAQRTKALRLARLGVNRRDIARCLGLTLDTFDAAIDRELRAALNRDRN